MAATFSVMLMHTQMMNVLAAPQHLWEGLPRASLSRCACSPSSFPVLLTSVLETH